MQRLVDPARFTPSGAISNHEDIDVRQFDNGGTARARPEQPNRDERIAKAVAEHVDEALEHQPLIRAERGVIERLHATKDMGIPGVDLPALTASRRIEGAEACRTSRPLGDPMNAHGCRGASEHEVERRDLARHATARGTFREQIESNSEALDGAETA